MDLGTDQQRLAIEVISTLVNIKSTMVEMILAPAGVPPEVYRPLFAKRNPIAGERLSKRQMAPLILEATSKRPDCSHVVRAIIEIAADWDRFELAHDEYEARATVQKAREMLGVVKLMEEREAKQRDLARKEALARLEEEQARLLGNQSARLLMMFDSLSTGTDKQQRGYLLQDLLNQLFDIHGIPVYRSFVRNQGGEQIDGAFKLDGWYYLVEARWRVKLADIRQLDGLRGQVDRSGKQAMGLFLSVEGWSSNVCPLLKQNSDKSIVLMDGYDLRRVLSDVLDLSDFILAKVAKLNFRGEPFLSVAEYLKQ